MEVRGVLQRSGCLWLLSQQIEFFRSEMQIYLFFNNLHELLALKIDSVMIELAGLGRCTSRMA